MDMHVRRIPNHSARFGAGTGITVIGALCLAASLLDLWAGSRGVFQTDARYTLFLLGAGYTTVGLLLLAAAPLALPHGDRALGALAWFWLFFCGLSVGVADLVDASTSVGTAAAILGAMVAIIAALLVILTAPLRALWHHGHRRGQARSA